MVVLRSREVAPTKPNPKIVTKPATADGPTTPAQGSEPSAPQLSPSPQSNPPASDSAPLRRRSLRLASGPAPGNGSVRSRTRKRKPAPPVEEEKEKGGIVVGGNLFDDEPQRDGEGVLSEVLNLRSGKRVVKRRVEYDGSVPGREPAESSMEPVIKTVRSIVNEKLEEDPNGDEGGTLRGSRRCTREEKGKIVEDGEKRRTDHEGFGNAWRERRRSYSREEKGKEKLVSEVSSLNGRDSSTGLELERKSKGVEDSTSMSKSMMDQFRDIARQNASRFAHFEVQDEEVDRLSRDPDIEMQSAEEEEQQQQKVEDWPGPFSTAMKIITDRANKVNVQQGTSTLEKGKSGSILWIPKKTKGCNPTKVSVPSLQEICIDILSKNADAITSLEGVPDDLRHRLSQLLCNSRKMNSHSFDLLVRGSPTEICVRDCSWLTEEEFTKSFKGCDTNNLTVLQLDQCGRCMPDYILLSTLAHSPHSLPSLATLSLSGACRVSDVGLTSLVASAPALQSINLSLCSLLTHASVNTLAGSLGSVLRELYIDDCQRIDAMVMLPAMKKLEHLEVLSVARVETICDKFMREFITTCGHNMKELVLAECVKLSDSSMKVIAEACSGLRSLNISKLRKLTDSTLGYLANGCHQIETLNLCQNAFSDEAVAAYLETSGELLKELVLNNVKKVGNNTALSLAKRSRKLQILDLSWCRNLRDEAVGLIVDSCLTLRVLKLFGCDQITNVFLDNHSNPEVHIIGMKLSPVLEHL